MEFFFQISVRALKWNGTLTFISKCSNDRINSEMSSDIPSNYANFSKKEWSNYFSVNIPTGPNETDLSGSNMRLTCTACRLNFTGNKTRAVAHFIGGDPWISKFPVPSMEAVIWARGDRNIANEKRKVHYDQSCTHKPEPTIKGTRTCPWKSICCCWGFGIFVDFPRWDGCFSTGKALHRCKLSEPDLYTKWCFGSVYEVQGQTGTWT